MTIDTMSRNELLTPGPHAYFEITEHVKSVDYEIRYITTSNSKYYYVSFAARQVKTRRPGSRDQARRSSIGKTWHHLMVKNGRFYSHIHGQFQCCAIKLLCHASMFSYGCPVTVFRIGKKTKNGSRQH